jgi:uncharacterized protein (DUF1697 family)
VARYVAFLRAINVGGHVVKMDRLAREFEALGLRSVQTFIASGNVIFESGVKDPAALERRIAGALEKSLGYTVPTFLRTDAEVARIAAHRPFAQPAIAAAHRFYVGFLAAPPAAAARQALLSLRSDIDDFSVDGRELYWISRTSTADSKLSNTVFEKKLGMPATFRGTNTVERIAAKYPPRA